MKTEPDRADLGKRETRSKIGQDLAKQAKVGVTNEDRREHSTPASATRHPKLSRRCIPAVPPTSPCRTSTDPLKVKQFEIEKHQVGFVGHAGGAHWMFCSTTRRPVNAKAVTQKNCPSIRPKPIKTGEDRWKREASSIRRCGSGSREPVLFQFSSAGVRTDKRAPAASIKAPV